MREEQREKLENQLREVLKKAIQNGEVSCGSFLVKKDGEEICCFQEGYAGKIGKRSYFSIIFHDKTDHCGGSDGFGRRREIRSFRASISLSSGILWSDCGKRWKYRSCTERNENPSSVVDDLWLGL